MSGLINVALTQLPAETTTAFGEPWRSLATAISTRADCDVEGSVSSGDENVEVQLKDIRYAGFDVTTTVWIKDGACYFATELVADDNDFLRAVDFFNLVLDPAHTAMESVFFPGCRSWRGEEAKGRWEALTAVVPPSTWLVGFS
jgi:hypothetical protein